MTDDYRGYYLVHRKIDQSWLWRDKPFAYGQAWIDMIGIATHESRIAKTRYGLVHLNRGELIASRRFLMDRWGWRSHDKVIRFLDLLEADRKIDRRNEARTTIVSIKNYDGYQVRRSSERSSTDLQPIFNRSSTDQPKELKELKAHKKEVVVDCLHLPSYLKKLRDENPPSIETAILAIYASHDSFSNVPVYMLSNALQGQPERERWPEAIEAMAKRFAGTEAISAPIPALERFLRGKTESTDFVFGGEKK